MNNMPNVTDPKPGSSLHGSAIDELPRRVLDKLLEGCQVIDPDFRYLYVNDAGAQQGHTTRDELLGRTMMEAFPGIEDTEMFAILRSCLQDRSVRQMENEVTFPDGTKGWFELRFEPVPEGVVILSVDISAPKRSEAALLRSQRALEESNARYLELVTNLEDVVFSLESDGRIQYMSPAIERIYGYTLEEMVDRSFQEFVHPEDLPELVAGFMRTLEGATESYEFRAFDTDGRIRHLRAKGHARLVEGHPVGLDGVLVDFTELRRAEDAKHEVQREHATLLGNLPGMAYRCANDRDWTMEIISQGCLELTGYPPEDLIQNAKRSYSDLIHPDDKERVWEEVQSAIADGRSFVFEYRLVTAAGDVKWVWEKGAPLRQTDDEVKVIEGFIMDITAKVTSDAEKDRLEEQLRLSQRLESIGRLAGGVAHDFNNLLTIIISHAGFVLEDLREPDPFREEIEQILDAAQRAAALTRQLLAFGRKQILEPEILCLNEVVGGIENMLRRLIGEDIVIATHLKDDLGNVEADPGQLEQVIMNLAVNARDAMPQGGRLTIETSNVELDESHAEQHVSVVPGSYVQLSVTDAGTGIDAETREHIFDPFFTTKDKGKGTGLGLATVYGIIKQSGGSIWVYSEPGQGTTFKIYLPRRDDPAVGIRKKPAAAVVIGDETVLVVEDEEAVRRLTERILRKAGYTVLAAANGGEALVLCEQNSGDIDLLLTDVVMPKMGGRELAERLAELFPKLKALYMSGYTDNAIVHHGVLDTGRRFISKPFSAAELTSKVREVLDEGET